MFDHHHGIAGFDEPIEYVVRHSPAVVPGSREPSRLYRKGVQQGRSERRGDAYSVSYVEPLSDARTPLAEFLNSLLGSVPGCGRGADAGLRPHLLCQKSATVLCRLAASVKD